MSGENTDPPPVANTKYGKVSGQNVRARDQTDTICAFLGIRYAAPPVGHRRFAFPEPPEPWEAVADATEFGAMAPQSLYMMAQIFQPLPCPTEGTAEDCLFLNVFTPDLCGSRPVMVWIHPGGLFIGAGSLNDGTSLAYRDVVVVTFNYRLGPLGFLSTGDEVIPGNCGFLDQQMALRWVRDNISAFGGDPGNVTLFGESAGSVCIQHHLVSPSSGGLFHHVICQSSAANIHSIALNDFPKKAAVQLAKALGCDSGDSAEIAAFLRKQPLDDVMAAGGDISRDDHFAFNFVLDDAVFNNTHPKTAHDKGLIRKVDFMTGICTTECYLLTAWLIPGFNTESMTYASFRDAVITVASKMLRGDASDVISVDDVVRVYGVEEHSEDSDHFKIKCCEILSDLSTAVPALLNSQLYAAHGMRCYLYQFDHRPSFSILPPWVPGSTHLDQSYFSFGDPFNFSLIHKVASFTSQEEEFSQTVMDYWTNFAKTGDPNGQGLTTWPKLQPDKHDFLRLLPTPVPDTKFKADKLELWKAVFEKLPFPAKE